MGWVDCAGEEKRPKVPGVRASGVWMRERHTAQIVRERRAVQSQVKVVLFLIRSQASGEKVMRPSVFFVMKADALRSTLGTQFVAGCDFFRRHVSF